jgi:hypothetical protein
MGTSEHLYIGLLSGSSFDGRKSVVLRSQLEPQCDFPEQGLWPASQNYTKLPTGLF